MPAGLAPFIPELLAAESRLRDIDRRAGCYDERPTVRLTWPQWLAICAGSPAQFSHMSPDYVPGPDDRILGRPIEMVEDYADSTVGQSQQSEAEEEALRRQAQYLTRQVYDGSWEITETRPPFRREQT